MAAERDKNGRFVGGNHAATGRTPLPPGLVARCRLLTLEGLPVVEEILRNAQEPGATRIKAWEALRDTGFGKPKATVDVNVYSELTNRDLAAEARRIAEELAGLDAGGDATGGGDSGDEGG